MRGLQRLHAWPGPCCREPRPSRWPRTSDAVSPYPRRPPRLGSSTLCPQVPVPGGQPRPALQPPPLSLLTCICVILNVVVAVVLVPV